MDKSELRRVFNCIEVGRHSSAKLIKMKTDKYNVPIKREVVDDNIIMKVPDEIAKDMAKKQFKKKVNNVEVCHLCAKEFWGRLSLLQHLKIHEGIEH